MVFFALTFAAGLLCVVIPYVSMRVLCSRWKLERRVFWRAGIAGFVAAMLVFGVTLNLDGTFANIGQLPMVFQALIFGLIVALFHELGKFLVLDRMMTGVRNRNSAVIFGLGWAGLGVMLTGIFLMVGTFGMQNLLNTKDLALQFPNLDADQMQFLVEGQKQIQDLVNGSPLKALLPLVENILLILVDIATAVLIVSGLQRKQTRQVWLAIAIKAAITALLFFVLS